MAGAAPREAVAAVSRNQIDAALTCFREVLESNPEGREAIEALIDELVKEYVVG